MESMERSFAATQWKPMDTGGNGVVAERDFGGVSLVEMAALDPSLIAKTTFTGCLNECLRHDGREDQEVARAIHISKGYLSKLLRSVWAAQIKRLILFCKETRCIAPAQKIADELGYELKLKQRKSPLELELERRERENEMLRRQLFLETGRAA